MKSLQQYIIESSEYAPSIKIVDTKDFFNSGILYKPSEIETTIKDKISKGTHIPTYKEWEAYRDELLTAYKNKYGKNYCNWSVTSIENMCKICPIIDKIEKERTRDNQFITQCLISDNDEKVFDLYELEFKPIKFGTARYVSVKK